MPAVETLSTMNQCDQPGASCVIGSPTTAKEGQQGVERRICCEQRLSKLIMDYNKRSVATFNMHRHGFRNGTSMSLYQYQQHRAVMPSLQ